MDKKEALVKVKEMLSAGEKKQDVFTALSGQGVKDRALAYFIASYVEPRRLADNKIHRRVVIGIGYLQAVLAILAGIYVAISLSVVGGVIVGALALLFAALFVRGFSKNNVMAYSVFIILSISQFSRQLEGFSDSPVATLVGLVVGVALVGYVAFVRHRLFPDFAFIGVKKVKGQYVFSD
jgi:hypothetical protein